MDTTHALAKSEMYRLIYEAGGDLSRVEWRYRPYFDDSWSGWRFLKTQIPMFGHTVRYEFRLAPEPVGRLPQVDLPLAETVAPQRNSKYYEPRPNDDNWYVEVSWVDNTYNRRALERGLVYLTAEDAIAVALATRVERVK